MRFLNNNPVIAAQRTDKEHCNRVHANTLKSCVSTLRRQGQPPTHTRACKVAASGNGAIAGSSHAPAIAYTSLSGICNEALLTASWSLTHTRATSSGTAGPIVLTAWCPCTSYRSSVYHRSTRPWPSRSVAQCGLIHRLPDPSSNVRWTVKGWDEQTCENMKLLVFTNLSLEQHLLL